MTAVQFAGAFGLAATSIQMLSALIAASRCARRREPLPAAPGAPPVTIVRPLCGIDPFAG